jgi:hypothetical protein
MSCGFLVILYANDINLLGYDVVDLVCSLPCRRIFIFRLQVSGRKWGSKLFRKFGALIPTCAASFQEDTRLRDKDFDVTLVSEIKLLAFPL